MKLFIPLFTVSFPIKVQVPSGHKPFIVMAVSLELKTASIQQVLNKYLLGEWKAIKSPTTNALLETSLGA